MAQTVWDTVTCEPAADGVTGKATVNVDPEPAVLMTEIRAA